MNALLGRVFFIIILSMKVILKEIKLLDQNT